MANTKQEKFKEIDQTMIVFLTDGEPTVGIQNVTEIKKNVRETNANYRIPIYGLAFGDDADFDLIKVISHKISKFIFITK